MSNPLSEVYGKFRVHYYRDVFNRIQARELSLSAVEVYCVEIIKALNKSTINEFANFINISSPNATYKVNSLIQKGYVVKVQSETDKREYYLDVTEKFYKYWNLSEKYLDIVEKRLEENLTAEEFETFNSILKKISNEMMPEVGLPERE
ncbi:MarR family transcriptional regulator [Eubacterium ruminantium]|uniref:MarR family transcriptional regulator n=1 Tax=Eubacterium ruminantium TaxID=42322 RepID=UPI000882FDCC|nr:MarR family transcriptional regulator [Eubacterium ruminantium]SDM14227.1 DNA-binding transcriptional regulator, MarR family [Eubacterium ruminantium]